jgi:hypothetical protein
MVSVPFESISENLGAHVNVAAEVLLAPGVPERCLELLNECLPGARNPNIAIATDGAGATW